MKSYLMTGIAALTLCAGFTSCSHDDFEPMTQAEIDKANYDMAFLKYVGGKIDKNQDWGFGSSTRALTRGENPGSVYKPNSDESWPGLTAEESALVPNALAEGEAEYVTKWFSENPGFTTESLVHWENFFVQHVSGKQQIPGIWHRYDQNRVNNGYDSNYYDEEITKDVVMDYLQVGSPVANTHVNDYNANSVGTEYRNGVRYIKGAGTDDFSCHISYTNVTTHNYKMAKLTYNGETAYYVGFSAWSEKEDNGTQELYAQRKEYCDCWIIKIVPGLGATISDEGEKYDLRIIAEDLSAQEAGDFDFNDVVFDVKYDANNAVINLLAAGGTLPLRIIAGDNSWEVHNEFGVSTGTMVNTNATNGVTKDPVRIELGIGVNNAPEANTEIAIEVEKNGTWLPLTAEKGEPAAKIAVGTSFQWLDERESIKGKYEKFVDWVNGTSFESEWWK